MGHLKIISRTIKPILTRLGRIYPWVKKIKIFKRKGIALFQGEIIVKE
jgi:hypothetical protein